MGVRLDLVDDPLLLLNGLMRHLEGFDLEVVQCVFELLLHFSFESGFGDNFRLERILKLFDLLKDFCFL